MPRSVNRRANSKSSTGFRGAGVVIESDEGHAVKARRLDETRKQFPPHPATSLGVSVKYIILSTGRGASPHRGSKSRVSVPMISTGGRRNSATCRENEGARQ